MEGTVTILLIDDSASIREVLRIALEAEGYRVIEAADGREGVTLFREHGPAVTIVDIVMPLKDGIETVREILGVDPAAVVERNPRNRPDTLSRGAFVHILLS
jgi:two-component system, chemotaxis family, chemotaxis protein CheY